MSITSRLEGAFARTAVGARLQELVARAAERAEPRPWTSLFGAITTACLLVLVGTGIVLTVVYVPSSEITTYAGSHAPLAGAEVSRAFDSTMRLSFDVRGGLLVRQAHHWAALLLPAAIMAQLLATFFTGAFRRRAAQWVLLVTTLLLALAAGWSGYALPDDMLSGTGLRIVEGTVLGIPVVGTGLAGLLFGGGFPGRVIENLWIVHLVASVAILIVVAVRLRGALRLPVLRAARSVPRRRVAEPARSVVTLLVTTVLLVALGAGVTIAPIWLYGPSDPGNASAGSQPDWYMGFLDGALRLVPPGWEVELGGFTLTLAVLVPLAVVGLFLAIVLAYPLAEDWAARHQPVSDRLDRPRSVPTRTAIGVAGMAFYGVLWGAASADHLATAFALSLEGVVVAFQVAFVVAPVVAFQVTRRVCLGLQRRDADVLAHGRETGRIVRLPGGEYVEVHAEVTGEERDVLARPVPTAAVLRPDARGRLRLVERVRVALSRLLFAPEAPRGALSADRGAAPTSSASAQAQAPAQAHTV